MTIVYIVCGAVAAAGLLAAWAASKKLRTQKQNHESKVAALEAELQRQKSRRLITGGEPAGAGQTEKGEEDLLNQELLQAQRLEAVRELAESLERDLPQIRGNLQIALSELEPQHPHHIILEAAAQTAAEAQNCAKNILRIIRAEPLDECTGSGSPSEPAHFCEWTKGSETILLAEDEFTLRAMTSRLLERIGYRVIAAENGAEALAVVEGSNERIDLLITDVVMPQMNGSELARRICRTHPEVKVLFTSGYADELLGRHGVLTEEVHYIGKPYTPEALAQKVRDVLEG